MRGWWIAVILVTTMGSALAGCGSPATVNEVVVHSNPIIANSTAGGGHQAVDLTKNPGEKGHISGVVVDAAIHPLAGAIVKIPGLDLQDVARRDGSFSFTELLPTAYYIQVNATGFYGAETLVTVQSGEITRVKFVLDSIPPPTPYHVMQSFKGFVEVTDSSMGIGTFLGGPGENFGLSLDRPGATLVIEATMDKYSGADGVGNNSFSWSLSPHGSSNYGYLASGDGANPLRAVVSGSQLGNATDFNLWVDPQSFPLPETEKSFTVFVTAFYNSKPPAGWSVVHGDA